MKPRRIDPVTRVRLTLLSRLFDWRDALVVVRPDTLLRWHRSAWRMLWRLRSRPGRPALPVQLQGLIRRMATENPLWGEERIANELLLKFGIRVSPRTVRKYMPRRSPGRPREDLRWSTFLRLHAQGILACDFCLAITASFRMLYVFVVIEHGTRRLVHCNVTAHPTAVWTLQQLREVAGIDHQYQFLLHDRDSIFSVGLNESIQALGIRVLRSAPHSPKMNALCERVIGTLRRECLDWVIPLSESHAFPAQSLDSALQPRPTAYVFGTWNSGSSGYHPPEIRLTASPLRGLFRPRQPDSRRTPSRILPRCRLIAFLRSTVMPIIRRRAKEVRESAVG